MAHDNKKSDKDKHESKIQLDFKKIGSKPLKGRAF